MVKINPFIFVKNGNDAIKLYEEVLGAKLIDKMPFSEEMGKQSGFPDDFDYENSTMHATLDVGGAVIMLSDNMIGLPSSGNVEIVLHFDNKRQLQEIYDKAIEKKFKISMALEKTFWGAWFTRFEDSEGVGWQLSFQEDERS